MPPLRGLIKLQADKAKYFAKQEEMEKKNPEPARMESPMRNAKPPTGAYESTNRDKGADVSKAQQLLSDLITIKAWMMPCACEYVKIEQATLSWIVYVNCC